MLFLQTHDYEVKDGKLCIALNGFVLVFYTADICQICDKLKPKFNKLATTVYGCTFAYMNVSQDNMKIRKLAAQTGFALDYVPMLVLYENRMPVAVFDLNESNLGFFGADLKEWLVKTTKRIMSGPGRNGKPNAMRENIMPTHLSAASQPLPTMAPSTGRPKPSARNSVGYKSYNNAYSSQSS